MNIDEGTKMGIEVTSEGIRLSLNLLSYILRVAADSLEQNENIIRNDTKTGKQKIDNLLKKHKDGIETLDENLTKQQVKDYQKELRKLSVDFSVIKNGKDNYSFFFASSQANIIEKALKNIIDKENILQNNDHFKDVKLEVDAEMNELTIEEKENVIEAYTEYYMTGDKEKANKLTEKEKIAFDKMEKMDNVKKQLEAEIDGMENEPPTEKQIKLAKKLGVKDYENMNKKTISIALEKAGADPSYFTNKTALKETLNERLSKLSESELELYVKTLEYDILSTSIALEESKTQKVASELKKLHKKHSKETLEKIKNIDKDIRAFDKYNNSNKLTSREALKEAKNKTFSLKNVKKIDDEIKKKEATKDKTKQIEHSR